MITTSVRLPEAQLEVVRELAKRDGIGPSDLIREGLRRVIDDRVRKDRSDA